MPYVCNFTQAYMILIDRLIVNLSRARGSNASYQVDRLVSILITSYEKPKERRRWFKVSQKSSYTNRDTFRTHDQRRRDSKTVLKTVSTPTCISGMFYWGIAHSTWLYSNRGPTRGTDGMEGKYTCCANIYSNLLHMHHLILRKPIFRGPTMIAHMPLSRSSKLSALNDHI